MRYSLACGDVLPGCAARFEAESEDELLDQVAVHAAADHGVGDLGPDLLERARAAVTAS